MKYIYETEAKNYEDFASGRVLYNQSGATSFPVRLGSEIYLRCKKHLQDKGVKTPFSVYDPCCGGAYLLTILAFLHEKDFSRIMVSDIDEDMLKLAKSNLSLLTLEGLEQRINQIKGYIEEFHKESHKAALESGNRLKNMIGRRRKQIDVRCFRADALTIDDIDEKVDLVITDVPYGNIVQWSNGNDDNLGKFLHNLLVVLKPTSVVAIVADKRQVAQDEEYTRLEKFKVGIRQITILEPNSLE